MYPAPQHEMVSERDFLGHTSHMPNFINKDYVKVQWIVDIDDWIWYIYIYILMVIPW